MFLAKLSWGQGRMKIWIWGSFFLVFFIVEWFLVFDLWSSKRWVDCKFVYIVNMVYEIMSWVLIDLCCTWGYAFGGKKYGLVVNGHPNFSLWKVFHVTKEKGGGRFKTHILDNSKLGRWFLFQLSKTLKWASQRKNNQ